MKLDTRFKEAFKVALAFAAVYGIALNLSWMNPSWAAYGVTMIALATAGQSIHKGLDRLAGTVPGCLSALLIIALAPQERWLYMLLASSWVFFTVYMMIRSKNNPYFWNVAGFVCLVILLTGPESSANAFQHAVYRMLETIMGVIVYTLITVFIWPRNNAGAIRSAIDKLVSTLRDRNLAMWEVISGHGDRKSLHGLDQQTIQQLGQISQALIAEGSENYEVRELRPSFEQFERLSKSLMECQDQLENSLDDMVRIDVKALLPGLQNVLDSQKRQFAEIRELLNGKAPKPIIINNDLEPDKGAIQNLPGFDLAAIVLIKDRLEQMDTIVSDMLECIRDMQGGTTIIEPLKPPGKDRQKAGTWLPVPDRDHFMGALFAALCCASGFLIWIFINPPGHAAWFELPAIFAMGVAVTQQARTTVFFKPFAFMLTLSLAVYVFILPQLSSFVGLGLVLFLCMFLVRYFYTGIAQLAGMVSVINMISIENQQTYNFAAQANALVFTLTAFVLVYAVSYMLNSPRPEKALLKMTGRFFRSTQFMVSRVASDPHRANWIEQWKTAYYCNEMETLPGKIEAWGKTIDHKLFPNTSQVQIATLVTSLRSLAYRVDELLTARSNTGMSTEMEPELIADFKKWLVEIEYTFDRWSSQPEARGQDKYARDIKVWLTDFETRANAFLMQNENGVSEQEAKMFYRLLGGFRGVSKAAVVYAEATSGIDWKQLREERFS